MENPAVMAEPVSAHAAHASGANPLLETAVACLVGRILLGQIGPRCAGA